MKGSGMPEWVHSREIVHGLRSRVHVASGFTVDILRIPFNGCESLTVSKNTLVHSLLTNSMWKVPVFMQQKSTSQLPRPSTWLFAWSCQTPCRVPWGPRWCGWRGHKVPSASLVAFPFSVPGESRPWVCTTCMTWPPSWRGSSLHYPGIFPGPEH